MKRKTTISRRTNRLHVFDGNTLVAEIPLMRYLVTGKESWMRYRNPI